MKILLVDDNEITLEIEKLMIENFGANVITAVNGKSAADLVRNENFSMIFMDIHMPDIDGYTAARLIRIFAPDIPIIALSADEIEPDDEAFIDSGMNGMIKKPVQSDVLKEVLSRYININEKTANAKRASDPVFDYESLIELVGDKQHAVQIVKGFLNVHMHDCSAIIDYLADGDYLTARGLLHDIIGISGNIFCRRLYDLSIRFDGELKTGNPVSLQNFRNCWAQTVEKLMEFVADFADCDTIQPETEWSLLWDDFVTLCKDFDIAATALFNKYVSAFRKNMSAEEFSLLEAAVSRYDFCYIIDNLEDFHVQGITC